MPTNRPIYADDDLFQLMCFIDDIFKDQLNEGHAWRYLQGSTSNSVPQYYYCYYRDTVIRIFIDNLIIQVSTLVGTTDLDIRDPEFLAKLSACVG